MRTLLVSLFVMFAAAVGAGAQDTWLDRPLTNWNTGSGVVPKAPASRGSIAANCRARVRRPVSVAEQAVSRAGWAVFGPIQSFGGVTLISGMTATGEACRASVFNTFVFVSGRFVGTLSPENMAERTEGSLRRANLENPSAIAAEFVRYKSADAMCCPSRTSFVSYEITRGAQSRLRPTGVDTVEFARPFPEDEEEPEAGEDVLTGTISIGERDPASLREVLTVRLVELTRTGSVAATIAEQRIDTTGRKMPFTFQMPFDRKKIVERNRYAVQAELRLNGRLTYIADTSENVITQGGKRKVEIELLPVGGESVSIRTPTPNPKTTPIPKVPPTPRPAPRPRTTPTPKATPTPKPKPTATPTPTPTPAPTPRETVIRGTVSYRERIALPPNSEVRVVLLNSAAVDDEPVAETAFWTGTDTPPYDFELRYEPRDINRQRSYEVRAEIRDDEGQVRFKSAAGTPVNLRRNFVEKLSLTLSFVKDEPPPVRGRGMILSRLGNGTLKIGNRTHYLLRGSVTIGNDGSATVSVGTATTQINLSGRLIFADDLTLRILVNNAGDVPASGEIVVGYTDRQLDTLDSTNLTVDGLDALLKY